jgi:hypothetical protein
MGEGDNFGLIVVFISACIYRCILNVWKSPLFTE